MEREKPQCVEKKIVAHTHLFRIEQKRIVFSNGVERQFECICSKGYGAVLIVAVDSSDNLLLVREYCAGTDRYELAFPKGLIEKGETEIEAANRELQEEIGYAANELTCLRSMTTAPGYVRASMMVVAAVDLYESRLPGDEPEPLEIVKWPLSDWQELLAQPDFTEARSVASLFLIKDWLKERKKNNE